MPQTLADSARLLRRVQALEAKSEKFSAWRIALFCVGALWALVVGFAGAPAVFQLPTAAAAFAFFWLVFVQDKVHQALLAFRSRLALARAATARQKADWTAIPPLPARSLPASLPRYFSDLDLCSGTGLLRLINHTGSTAGLRRLVDFFDSNGVTTETVTHRQKITREMAKLRVLRRKFLVVDSLWSGLIESDRLTELIERPLHTSRAYLAFGVVASTHAAFGLLFVAFALFGGRPFFLAFGFLLLVAYRWAVREVRILQAYDYGMSLDVSLGKFAALAQVAGRMSSAAGPALKQLLLPFQGERNPRRVLARTGKVVGFLGVRQNHILHLAVNMLVPWDFFWTLRLEKLRKEVQAGLPTWQETLAELEVAVSLAEFAALHPSFSYAQIRQSESHYLRCEYIAHPLIPPDTRVGNDFTLSVDKRCLIITGSNMSGKSTFLRTLGVNLLLAKAGTVVCAKHFETRALDLMTSLRLNDSLEEGLSSFYAEVRQIKTVLDLAQAGRPLLYLIDEVFRGTNNRERLIGSRAFVKQIAQTGACGLITTHDLELASLEAESAHIANYHFKEDIEGDRMLFSYTLAQGPCPTTNALRVMQLAGLPVE